MAKAHSSGEQEHVSCHAPPVTDASDTLAAALQPSAQGRLLHCHFSLASLLPISVPAQVRW